MKVNFKLKKGINTTDWHNADIVAELKKRGFSLRKLSIANGLSPNTLRTALDKPYLKAEKIIAEAMGLTEFDVWPQRQAHRNFVPKYPNYPTDKN